MSNFTARWEAVTKNGDEFLKFEKVNHKRSSRPDLHAFIMLGELFPSESKDLICAAEHDEIWLDIDGSKAEILTDSQILELSRCGVRWDESNDCLCMFV